MECPSFFEQSYTHQQHFFLSESEWPDTKISCSNIRKMNMQVLSKTKKSELLQTWTNYLICQALKIQIMSSHIWYLPREFLVIRHCQYNSRLLQCDQGKSNTKLISCFYKTSQNLECFLSSIIQYEFCINIENNRICLSTHIQNRLPSPCNNRIYMQNYLVNCSVQCFVVRCNIYVHDYSVPSGHTGAQYQCTTTTTKGEGRGREAEDNHRGRRTV